MSCPLHRANAAYANLDAAVDMLLSASTPARVEAAIAFLRRTRPTAAADFRSAITDAAALMYPGEEIVK